MGWANKEKCKADEEEGKKKWIEKESANGRKNETNANQDRVNVKSGSALP